MSDFSELALCFRQGYIMNCTLARFLDQPTGLRRLISCPAPVILQLRQALFDSAER